MRAFAESVRRFWDDRGPAGRGQAVVEFAIAFPLQLFLTFGLMQLALNAIAVLMVNYASYAAARALLVGEDPARAAMIVLTPLAGPTAVSDTEATAAGRAAFSDGLRLPGWGVLRGSERIGRKVHVTVDGYDGDFYPAGVSRFTLKDPYAYDEELRFTAEAIEARRRARDAVGTAKEVRVGVQFDYELLFPVVDLVFEAFLRPAGAPETQRVFGSDADAPARGLKPKGAGGIRTWNGAKHLVINRTCVLYRGRYAAGEDQ